MSSLRLDAIVLAGGRGRRLGGADKASIRLRDERLIDRAVGAARRIGVERIVVVGPRGATDADAVSVREDPPFSGPLAALAAGLAALESGSAEAGDRAEWVLLLACDLEHPGAVCDALASALARARDDDRLRDGVLLEDPGGRSQWLAGVYRRSALRDGLDAAGGELADLPLRLAFSRAELIRCPATAEVTADIDTPEDLERARRSGRTPEKERS